MTRQQFYYWLFFSLPVIYFLSMPIATGDLAVWVAHGKYILSHGHILRNDIFSILPTKALVYPVGTCLLYGSIYFLTGLIGVSLFHKMILILISYIWKDTSLNHLENPFTITSLLLILFSWFGCSMYWIDRPALIGMIPLLISFNILQKSEDLNDRDYFYLTLINIAWVNLHGSWPLLMLMYAWREFTRRCILEKRNSLKIIMFIPILLLTSLLNPFGYKVFSYVFETTKISKLRQIDEWAQPNLTGHYQSQVIAYFILLVLFVGYSLYGFLKKKELFKSMITSPFVLIVFLGLIGVRNTALPFFILIPFSAKYVLSANTNAEKMEKKSVINLLITMFTILLFFLFLPYVKPYVQNILPDSKKAVYDTSTVEIFSNYLNKTEDIAPLFNNWDYGSYLILSQKHPIFIDTRNIIYSDKEFFEYQKMVEGHDDWKQIIEKYKIKYILLNKKMNSLIIAKLKTESQWENVLMDENAILFEKKN